MADTSFVNGTTIVPNWLNDVNNHVYKGRDFAGITPINVKDPAYGAKGDGVTDDTAALNAAEAAANSLGRGLFVPAGTYNYNGSWTIRVNTEATGATIRQIRPTVSANNTAGTVVVGANSIVINGMSVDSQLKSTGFAGDGFNYYSLRNCRALNCVNLGIGIYNAIGVDLWYCTSINVRYNATGVAGLAADPFYFGGCLRCRWIGCYAEDFRRIGFVSEGAGATKSSQIQALFCQAVNANNCDDSTTEYNAGFWAENTNSIDWLYCTASNIATGVGQTNGRVTGLWALGGGNNSRGAVNVIGCKVFGGTNYLPSAMRVIGSGTFADVNIENCYLNRARSGIVNGCGLNSLNITNISMEDIITQTAADGGILTDASGGGLLPILTIDTLFATNSTWVANTGIVNFFSAPFACKYTIRNVKGAVPHVMRTRVQQLISDNCEIAIGSTNYGSFQADNALHIEPTYTPRNASNADFITMASALATGASIVFRGGSIDGSSVAGGWAPEFSGNSISLASYNTKYTNFCWPISTLGSYVNQFDACQFYSVPATIGAIRTTFGTPAKQVFIVQNCYFQSNNVADTPIRKWNNDPTKSILQGNSTTATALTTFTAPTSNVNNVLAV